jgi:hypothetical protein
MVARTYPSRRTVTTTTTITVTPITTLPGENTADLRGWWRPGRTPAGERLLGRP